jgi:hypothetical protein
VICRWNCVLEGVEGLFEVRMTGLQLRIRLGPPRKIGVVTLQQTNRAALPLLSSCSTLARRIRLHVARRIRRKVQWQDSVARRIRRNVQWQNGVA